LTEILSPQVFGFLILISLLFGIGVVMGILLGRAGATASYEKGISQRIGAERGDAVKRSRAVLGGQVAEQMAPYLPDFPCDPGSAHFLGKPVDYVCFPALPSGEIEEVVFVEIKTGLSELSSTERQVKAAILDGRIRWVEYRIPLSN
jgi:predicted Holliday junction resolvase-like endonuclease